MLAHQDTKEFRIRKKCKYFAAFSDNFLTFAAKRERMKKLDKQAKIEFLRKLKALLAEYNASIEVVDAGWEYEGHLTIYENDVQEVFEFEFNKDITVGEIDKAIEEIEKRKRL